MFMVTPPHDAIILKDIIQWSAVFLACIIVITLILVNFNPAGEWTKRYRNWKGWKNYD